MPRLGRLEPENGHLEARVPVYSDRPRVGVMPHARTQLSFFNFKKVGIMVARRSAAMFRYSTEDLKHRN